jgi:hypothetical protein
MKTLLNIKNRLSFLTTTLLLGFIILSGTASAQAPAKGKKAGKIPQATLKEAKVTAPILTTVEEVGPMQFQLNVLNPTGEKVRINISNYRNEAIFQDAFSAREYKKVLNFKIALPGRYSLQVAGSKKSETRQFEINSKNLRTMTAAALENKESAAVMATIFSNGPTQIKLHLVNNTGKPATYLLRNEAKEIIDNGHVSKSQFTKAFNMAAVPNGKYTFEVTYMGDKTATRTFDMQTVNARSLAWTDKRGRPLPPVNYSGIPLPSAVVTFNSLK